MKSIPDEDAVKTVEMTTKDLEYYINLVDKIAANCLQFWKKFYCDKMLSNSIARYGENVHERKKSTDGATCLILSNCHSHQTFSKPWP